MNENIEKLEQLLSNPEEAERVFVSDVEQTLANLAAHGIEMTAEDLAELSYGILDSVTSAEDGELSEEALENVAGGYRMRVGFFRGYADGLKDSEDYTCKKTKGGPLYRLGYRCGQIIGGAC